MTQPAHGWRSHYALLILLFVYTAGLYRPPDHGHPGVQPIKQEFGVSDTAMGVLTGVTFALFYSALAIPVWPLRRPRQQPSSPTAAPPGAP